MIANNFQLMGARPRTGLVTDRDLARNLQVSRRMIHLWVDTGAWPLPRRARRTSFLFEISDVERWLETGVWPASARFRAKVAHTRRSDRRVFIAGREEGHSDHTRRFESSRFDQGEVFSCRAIS